MRNLAHCLVSNLMKVVSSQVANFSPTNAVRFGSIPFLLFRCFTLSNACFWNVGGSYALTGCLEECGIAALNAYIL